MTLSLLRERSWICKLWANCKFCIPFNDIQWWVIWGSRESWWTPCHCTDSTCNISWRCVSLSAEMLLLYCIYSPDYEVANLDYRIFHQTNDVKVGRRDFVCMGQTGHASVPLIAGVVRPFTAQSQFHNPAIIQCFRYCIGQIKWQFVCVKERRCEKCASRLCTQERKRG